jgi:hypothetical protein
MTMVKVWLRTEAEIDAFVLETGCATTMPEPGWYWQHFTDDNPRTTGQDPAETMEPAGPYETEEGALREASYVLIRERAEAWFKRSPANPEAR